MTNYYNSLCIGRDTVHKKTKFGASGDSPNTTKTSRWWLASLFMVMSLFMGQLSFGQTVIVGTGGITTTSTGNDPISGYYNAMRFQTVYTAAELSAAGLSAGSNISGLGWSIAGDYGGGNLLGYTIKLGNTSATNSAAHDASATTVVKNAFNYNPTVTAAGVFDMIAFDTNFMWNGTSNILVEVCTDGPNPFTSPYGQVRAQTMTTGSRYYQVDGGTACGVATNTTNGNRPQVQFSYIAGSGCTGTPAPGNTLSSVASACVGVPFTLSLQNATTGSGVTYQWQSADDMAFTTNVVALGTSGTQAIASQTAASYYRCSVTCAGSTTISTPVLVGQNAPTACYCTPTGTSGSTQITNVTMNGASTLNNTSAGNAGYGNFTAVSPTVSQSPDLPVSFTLTYVADPGTAIYVDWNNNGIFDASERMYNSASYIFDTTSGSFIIPSGQAVGTYRMRVVADYNSQNPVACPVGINGETEDYTIEVLPPPACLPPSSLAVADVAGTTATINWDCVGCTGTFELDYGSAGHTAGTGTIVTGATSGYSLSSLSGTTAYTVYVRQDCGGGSYSPWSTVNFTTTLDCAAAIVLTADVPETSGLLATTGGVYNNNACLFTTPGKEALYSFTTTAAGVYILTVSNLNGGSGYIDYMYKEASLGCGPTGWTCIDDNNALGTDSMTLLAGTTYYILLDAESASGTANHTFSIGQAALVPGCATLDLPADASTDVDSATVTLSWTAPAVTATEGVATSYKVYFGTVNPPLTLASSPATTSYTRTGLAYSTTYYWSVTSVNSGGDSVGCTDVYSFTTEADPCTGVVPTGDTFADPIVLGALVNGTPTTSAGDNLATNCWHDDYTTSSTPGNGSARPGRDIFYQFEITDLCNTLTVATCGASFDTYLHILDATGTRVAFNDDGCGTSSTLTTSTLVPGIYYAVVDGYNATSEGTFTLSFDYTSTPSVTYYADADGDTFGDATGNPVELCAPATGFVTNNLDCDDNNPAVNPDATEIAYDGIDNNCDGQLDEGFPPQSTTLKPGSCGVTLAGLDTVISATPVSGATDYRYKVSNGMEVQTFETTRPWFRLTYLPNYDYATTYTVEVEIKKGGVWLGYYGDPCTVTTPAISPSLLSFTSPTCGSTLASVETLLLMNAVPRASGYRFEVTHGATTEVLDTTNPYFRLQELPSSYVYGTTYTVRIAVRTGASGVYTTYGSPCSFTTPAVPQIAECGATIAAGSIATVPSLRGVTTYTFEVTTPTEEVITINRSVPYFIVNSSSIPGYSSTTPYFVRVSLTTAGGVSPWGDSCSINPAAAAAVRYSNTVSNEFKAKGFPNPFTNNFTLDITRASEEKVSVMVYDMIGKLLDRVEVNATDNSLELGANYPAGVYNVIVSQGEKVETVRMVKR